MTKRKRGITRRDFLRGASAATLAGAAGVSVACDGNKKPPAGGPPSLEEHATPEEPAAPVEEATTGDAGQSIPDAAGEAAAKTTDSKAAKVVLVRDDAVLDKRGRPVAEVLARMVDEGVTELLGESDAAAAWARLIKPDDIVGIKSNVWRFLPTPRELEEILRDRIRGAGVPDEHIGVGDRRVRGNRVFRKATALINARPMRTHHWSGVGSLLKNYINFYDGKLSDWHRDSCANLAGLWEMPLVKGKTRLNILVMLTPLFHGKGPHHFHARYTWHYRGLLFGTDPVAVDSTGLRILEAKRKLHFGKERPFSTPPKHIRVAEEKYGLGVADPEKIELVKLGWDEDVLI